MFTDDYNPNTASALDAQEEQAMKAMFTPGPWTVHTDPPSGHDGHDERDKGGFRIDTPDTEQLAYVWNESVRYGSERPFGSKEGEANARLIAAAPDFYKSATTNYGGWVGPELLDAAADHCDDSAIADLLRQRAKADRAAIAKARGSVVSNKQSDNPPLKDSGIVCAEV